MAEIAALEIKLALKGLSQVKKGLDDLQDSFKGVGKLSKEDAKLVEKFGEAVEDSIVKPVQKANFNVKEFSKELKTFSRDLGVVSRTLQQFGSAVTGAFTAAFITSRKELPAVDQELKKVKNSLEEISKSVAEATLPTLQEFSGVLVNVSNNLKKIVRENSELLNFVLKFGAQLLIFGTFGRVLQGISRTIEVIVRTLVVGSFVSRMTLIVTTVTAMSLALDKLLKKFSDPSMKLLLSLAGGPARAGGQLINNLFPAKDAEELNNRLKETVDVFGQLTSGVKENFLGLANNIKELGRSIGQALDNAFSETLFQAITGRIKGLRSILLAFLDDLARAFSQRISNTILGFIIGDKEGNQGLFGKLGLGALSKVFGGGGGKSEIEKQTEKVSKKFDDLATNMDKFSAAKDKAIEGLKDLAGKGKEAFSGIQEKLGGDKQQAPFSALAAVGSSIGQAIAPTAVPGAPQGSGVTIPPISPETIQSGEDFNEVMMKVNTTVKGIVDNVKLIGTSFKSAMVESVSAFTVASAVMFAVGTAFTIAATAVSGAAALALAALWAPAALFASIATFGAAAKIGSAALGSSISGLGGQVAGAFASSLGGAAKGSISLGQGAGGGEGIPATAEGGIVRKPQVRLVGEAGPEAIVPLDKAGQLGGINVTINSDIVFADDPSSVDRLVRGISEGLKRATNRRTGGLSIAL